MQFVLVHGSWHEGNCWDGVRRHLELAGHSVMTPTLPGNGPDGDRNVSMQDTWRHVADEITRADLSGVALVGHSFGGAVVQLVAQEIPDRISHAIFHNAYVVENGASVFSYIPAESAAAFQSLEVNGEVMVPFELFHAAFMNDADEESARAAFATLSPEPLARATEPLNLATFPTLDIKKAYVHATEDQVFPSDQFSWHPGMSKRLGDFELIEIPGSHEVLFTAPDVLAKALLDATAD